MKKTLLPLITVYVLWIWLYVLLLSKQWVWKALLENTLNWKQAARLDRTTSRRNELCNIKRQCIKDLHPHFASSVKLQKFIKVHRAACVISTQNIQPSFNLITNRKTSSSSYWFAATKIALNPHFGVVSISYLQLKPELHRMLILTPRPRFASITLNQLPKNPSCVTNTRTFNSGHHNADGTGCLCEEAKHGLLEFPG